MTIYQFDINGLMLWIGLKELEECGFVVQSAFERGPGKYRVYVSGAPADMLKFQALCSRKIQ
jgi:hypothetical protein